MCSNLFKTCSNVFKCVQTYLKLVQIYSNVFICVQTCSNLFKCVQMWSNLFKIRSNVSSVVIGSHQLSKIWSVNIFSMGILWNKHSWKQILWPENTTQNNYEHKKTKRNWGGQSWYPWISIFPTSRLPPRWAILRWGILISRYINIAHPGYNTIFLSYMPLSRIQNSPNSIFDLVFHFWDQLNTFTRLPSPFPRWPYIPTNALLSKD